MDELKKTSGLPLAVDGEGKLIFGEGLTPVTAAVRFKQEMMAVLFAAEADSEDELYYMYRDVCRTEDRSVIAKHGLRYDVTVIRPGQVGSEYIKTAGHYHPLKQGTDSTYPEVYEVLSGRAHYLLQTKPDEDGVDAILVEALPGDKVLIPPGYGHITINPGATFLVMSNWVAAGFDSVYGVIKELGGGAYFELVSQGEDQQFVVNPRYLPAPRFSSRPVEDRPEFGLLRGHPMYQEFLKSPEKFDFLRSPEKYF
ncbi:glucose-6-phosphate isomerase, archaeal [Candidatus Hakubella thermalkaliphila]|uniref:glucose-6-phosphate isomerase n=1 Tax=Candidatus Hakubella thermalkaliphila TaxID=2754717 RepID=A0A6V8NMP7_9ACTN|nr:glucose-6-phosphate isomerase family protein [Candidatus Hakubella thermalkaliphila]MBT9167534.1 Glucose-6-phosphate isomerase [Bacillota bacterium]GFP19766.1 glucose-6-phosphate isomerase, archaeal [Candidatus Hakubella thermalkaliphila]GFP43628.1 glucose-6-phosphate isomerase, archaeal [Candidatus Hakubella thermalkaliphila]